MATAAIFEPGFALPPAPLSGPCRDGWKPLFLLDCR
jgi:hypothetical protein